MEFQIQNINESINSLMRKIGYKPAYFQNAGETSIVRQIGRNDYPRFHLYIVQRGTDMIFKLHLDQKKPSYDLPAQAGGYHAHSGDYDGPVVESEAERIKRLVQ
jgi:hypothetical protein